MSTGGESIFSNVYSHKIVLDRLLQATGAENDSQLAERLGVPRGTVGNWRSRGTVPVDACVNFAFSSGYSVDWLVLGRLPRMHTEPSPFEAYQSSVREAEVNEKVVSFAPPGYILIPKLDVRAAAGSGVEVIAETETGKLAFRLDWLSARGLTPRHLAVITVQGESGKPELMPGDLVLIDRKQREPRDGVLMVLRIGNELLIKRTQRLIDGFVLLSKNSEEFPPVPLSGAQLADVEFCGRVVASMREW